LSDHDGNGAPTLRVASISVEYADGKPTRYAATISLHGEHDLATRGEIEALLAPSRDNVLVDLRDCDFLSIDLIRVLVGKAHELRATGDDLEIVVPPRGPNASRTVELIGLGELVNVYPTLPETYFEDGPSTVVEDILDDPVWGIPEVGA
jgi:anti-anti-sigma factor